MPRRARVTLPGVAHHVIQRGNNRQPCFYNDRDRRLFLDWLEKYAAESDCLIHAYVLMTNHFHLLATPAARQSLALLMKHLGQRYVQYVNRTYDRTGSLWEGRFRSCLVQSDVYALHCYRYIELNPVRAAMVAHPAEYRWSSYRVNAQGESSTVLSPHPVYLALGCRGQARRAAYRALFADALPPDLVDEFRIATNGNFAVGSDRFKRGIEAALGRRVSRGRPGRPRTSDQ